MILKRLALIVALSLPAVFTASPNDSNSQVIHDSLTILQEKTPDKKAAFSKIIQKIKSKGITAQETLKVAQLLTKANYIEHLPTEYIQQLNKIKADLEATAQVSTDSTIDTISTLLVSLEKKLPYTSKEIDKITDEIASSNLSDTPLSEEVLAKFITCLSKKKFTQHLDEAEKKTLSSINASIIGKQKAFKMFGFACCFDNGNFSVFGESNNKTIPVHYKNKAGQTKSRNYNARINSVGVKIDINSYNLNFIFFTDVDLDFYTSNKEITLGTGAEVEVYLPRHYASHIVPENIISRFLFYPLFSDRIPVRFIYVPFQNVAGSMIICSFSLVPWIKGNLLNLLTTNLLGSGWPLPAINIITGGSLTPCT